MNWWNIVSISFEKICHLSLKSHPIINKFLYKLPRMHISLSHYLHTLIFFMWYQILPSEQKLTYNYAVFLLKEGDIQSYLSFLSFNISETANFFNKINSEKKEKYYYYPLNSHLLETFIHVLKMDGQSVSRPVHVPEDNFNLTEAFSDSLLTEKAHHLIRMIQFSMGVRVFCKCVEAYYLSFQNENSNLDEVWQVFTQTGKNHSIQWLKDTDIKAIMDSWIKKKRFPLINVQRTRGKSAEITQEPFIQLEDQDNENEATSTKDFWLIPLAYTTKSQNTQKNSDGISISSEGKFRDSGEIFKISGETSRESGLEEENQPSPVIGWFEETTIHDIEDDDWLLLKFELNVFCRVNYDKANWKLLHDVLIDEENYFSIDGLSRTRLVSDMFALAEVGKFPYTNLFETMKYLSHEAVDFPLMIALKELNRIHWALFGTKALVHYEKYMKVILTSIFGRKLSTKIIDGLNAEENDMKKLVIISSCNCGVDSCISMVKEYFKNWNRLNKFPKKVSQDTREIVLCQAIKYGRANDWDLLFKFYEEQKDQGVRKSILTALGCSRDTKILQKYLSLFNDGTIPSKYTLPVISGLTSNQIGYGLVKELFVSRFDEMMRNFEGCEDVIGIYLTKLFEFTITREDFNELEKISVLARNHLKGVENLLKENMRMAKRTYLWREKHQQGILNYFQNPLLLKLDSVFVKKNVT